ncbi:MAG: hypothetical protein ACLFUS_07105 [Candidatus Sumerlaeia bacterium]
MPYLNPQNLIQKRLGDREQPHYGAAILVFRDHAHSMLLLKKLKRVRPIQYRLIYNLSNPHFEPLVYEAEIEGHNIIIVTRCVWGGPQTAILVEELACLGVRYIIGDGVAGSIVETVPRGSLLAITSSLPTDGTSRAYGVEEICHPDAGLLDKACDFAHCHEWNLMKLQAAQVDALYCETPELAGKFRDQGCQLINMESSTFYALCRKRGIAGLWLGYVSDCLVGDKWDDWFAPVQDSPQRVMDLCCHVLASCLKKA